MKEINIKRIEEAIGYKFKNTDLLYQAYVDTTLDVDCDNKSLAFVGDTILTSVVTSYLANIYSCDENVFSFTRPIEVINDLKVSILSKKYLQTRVNILNVKEYYNDGIKLYSNQKLKDIAITILKAIIGAIAYDSDYNYKYLNRAVIRLVNPSNYILSYTGVDYKKRIEDYIKANNEEEPLYETWLNDDNRYVSDLYIFNPGVDDVITSKIFFRGFGFTSDEAKEDSARAGYEYLVREGFLEPSILDNDTKRIKEIIKSSSTSRTLECVGKLVNEKLLSKPIISIESINKRYYAKVLVDEYKEEFLGDSSKIDKARRRALESLLNRILQDIEKAN